MAKPVLFTDAVFHTGRTEVEAFRHMLVKNGRVEALVDEEPPAGSYSRAVSLGGAHVFPCLVDAHVHLLPTIVLLAAGFEACRIENGRVEPHDLAGLGARIRAFAADKKQNAVLVANNCIPSALEERRLPARQELDDWAGSRAIAVYTIDGHSSAHSSRMLEQLGIDPKDHSGMLMGEAHERVQGRLTDVIAGSITPKVLAKGVANFENACAAFGISHVGALEGNGDSKKDPTTKLCAFLARRMTVNIRMYFQYMDVARVDRLRHMQKRPRIGGCGDWEMDGAIGSHSAAFDIPYKDTGEIAQCYYTQEFVDEKVREADEKGYQIASHAIGERAIERITRALAKTSSGRFHRVEHGEFGNEETDRAYLSGRFAVLMQPGYAWIDKRYLHTYEQYADESIVRRLRFASLLRAGAILCGSSDSPVQSLDPYQQMRGMTEFYYPEESVTPYEAFVCYTKNPARALLEESEIGTLEVGKEANFFTAGRDFFALAPHEVGDFRPTGTWYKGVKYECKKGTVGELGRIGIAYPKPI
ncbi:MAG TPA: amidohydrolase family protein [Clostridia bacterium]|nr:amidohydrolase family protein [Clostridia bacterium]